MTLTLTYDRGAGVYKQRGQVLTTVTVGETRGSEILGVINTRYESLSVQLSVSIYLIFLEKDTERDNLTMAMSLSKLLESQPGCCTDLQNWIECSSSHQ